MRSLVYIFSSIGLLACLFGCTEASSQDNTEQVEKIRKILLEAKPKMTHSKRKIRKIISELQQKKFLDIYETTLLQELQKMLRDSEIKKISKKS